MRPSAEGRPAAQGCPRTLATAAWIGPRESGMASFTCLPSNALLVNFLLHSQKLQPPNLVSTSIA